MSDKGTTERAKGYACASAAGYVGERIAGTTWHHIDSGGIYTIVACAAREDMSANVVVYRDRAGATWTRPQADFFDGRFERVAPDDGEDDATLPKAERVGA